MNNDIKNDTHDSECPTSIPAAKCRLNHSSKMSDSCRNFSLAVAGILIGLFGGVPGFLSIMDYFNKSSVRIVYDVEKSIPCYIANSQREEINGKFSILLYGVTIVGKGNQKFVVYDITLSIRIDGVWHKGVRFKPEQHEFADQSGYSGTAVQVHIGSNKPFYGDNDGKFDRGETISFADWHDFDPGVSVAFGEPSNFMVAFYFLKVPHDAIKKMDRLKIIVQDYLGNAYTEEYKKETLFIPPFDLFLDQST